MATEPDPYRTLGLPRTATLDEVKRAYRRLAKANHPDAAGEAALPRFLAIQAAYDRIAGPDTARGSAAGGAPGGPAGRASWDADPQRADATRRAYGNRARRRPPTARPAGADEPAPGVPPRPAPPPSRGRRPRRATLGSTSYDEASEGPFEPGWGGASWYGTSSGTYWTLNPKEYADPRKHGPEYQARARRASRTDEEPSDDPATNAGPAGAPVPEPATPSPGHTTRSWWEATAGTPADDTTQPDPPPAHAGVDERRQAPSSAPPPAGGAPRDPRPPTIDALRAWVASDDPGLPLRLGRAALGWAPIALGIGWLAGELTGCGRFAASCDAGAAPVAWFAQVVALALLLIVPPLARIAAIAAVATIAAAIAGAFLLTATGSAGDRDWGRIALGATLVIAWLVGLAYAIVREVRALGSGGQPGEIGEAGSRGDSAAGGGPVS